MTNYQEMMRHAADQLRREGVPEANIRAAAAHLVGQGYMESGLNPDASHDNGTGFGIYGARLGRRDAMLAWLQKNGYAQNSPEGQMRYMAHEAMSAPDYAKTKSLLMNASPDGFDADSRAITANFERPAVINDRSGAVRTAWSAWDGSTPPMGGVPAASAPPQSAAAAGPGVPEAPQSAPPSATSAHPLSLAGLLTGGRQVALGGTGAAVGPRGLQLPGGLTLEVGTSRAALGGQQQTDAAPEQQPLSMAGVQTRRAAFNPQTLSQQLQSIGLRGIV